ncbi:pheromone processing endoprotease [Savitreella phatthalungensis]
MFSLVVALFWLGSAAARVTWPREYEARDYFVVDEKRTPLVDFMSDTRIRYEHSLGELKGHHMLSIERGQGLSRRDLPAVYPQEPRLRIKRELSDRQQLDPELDALFKSMMDEFALRDPIIDAQWHLFNRHFAGHDINVTGVWRQGIHGRGVTVSLIDDGIDMDSRDLGENYYAAGSYDFNDHNDRPSPKLFDDYHGTRCAGEIAALRNDVCGIGIAHEAKLSGLRILSARITDADEALALNYDFHNNHIYSCSWGPPDDGKSMEGPSELIERAFINGIRNGRNGKGSIFVFASGNGAMQEDNCNFDGYTNSIYSITIGAIDRMDFHPYYSELCAPQLAVTYSSGSGEYIHTTDVGEAKCTDRHGGTSAAAPLAAGIFALVLSIRPDLTWRDLQYLVVETALPFQLEDEDWQETVPGRRFNHKFGFGKLDAWAIVERAKTWELVKPQAWYSSPAISVGAAFGEDGNLAVESVFNVSTLDNNVGRIEHVTVTVDITHASRGQLVIDLISPGRVRSSLATRRSHDEADSGLPGWTFMTVKHWGEDGTGDWTLRVSDPDDTSKTGIFNSWSLKLWGEAINPAITFPLPYPGEGGSSEDLSGQPEVSSPIAMVSATATQPSVPTPTEVIDVPDRPTKVTEPIYLSKSAVWVYAAIASLVLVSGVAALLFRLTRRSDSRDPSSYEFKQLSPLGDDLFDAFADIATDSDEEHDGL